ncbi:MAG: DinB family protein [Phycisphaeraceae bacterium]|nr:DinB family protein [Phycisphaeraceae bacterium]
MSAESTCRDELVDHFTRAWDMVIEAVERFPDADWSSPDDHRYTPARLAYHLLKATERYTYTGDPQAYLAQQRFNKDWVEAPVSDLLAREPCLMELRAARDRSIRWLREAGAHGLTETPSLWSWVGGSLLSQAIYALRHIQHHQAELNQALKRLGLQPVKWR